MASNVGRICDVKYERREGRRHRESAAPDQFTENGTRPEIFRHLKNVARAIVELCGPNSEAVVHDLSDPEHSIIALYGNLTGRHIGGAITDYGLTVLATGGADGDVLSYTSVAPDGRRLKSASILVREQQGEMFGALCINLDVDSLHRAAESILAFTTWPNGPTHIDEHFTDDPNEVISSLYHEEVSRVGCGNNPLNRDQRIALVRALRNRGIFSYRNAPTVVAGLLKVSRHTIYNYLNHDKHASGDSVERP